MDYYSYVYRVMKEILLTPLNMKTLNEIQAFAETNDAVSFDKYCDSNGISNEWLDVTLTDFNDGYYNVYLEEYGVNVMYYNGKLEELG